LKVIVTAFIFYPKALKVMVNNKYKEAKEKAREQLHKGTAISLTSDMRTYP